MNKQKSKALQRAEFHLQSKLNATFANGYPHYLMPGYNLNKSSWMEEWNEENVMGLFQEFPYNCGLPKPLLPPARLSRTVLSKEDPALELLNIKRHLTTDINRIIKYYKKYEKDFDTVKKKVKWSGGGSGYTAKIPKYIADIAELIDMDPDPYFEGTYNWYYTGGSLNCAKLNGSDVLLFPFMGDFVAAHIVHTDDSLWKPLLQKSAKSKLHGVLYEIRESTINNRCRILGRYKNQCAIYTLSNLENQLAFNEIHKQASKIPYVSADLSLTNVNYHCTLNAEKALFLWDITRENHISSGSIVQDKTKTHDAWGSVRFQQRDSNVLIYTDRCCLHYLDIRSPFDHPSLTLCPKSHLEKCESLSVDAESRNSFCRYVGTTHSLLMCDERSPQQCIQQKWTHQFKDVPLSMAITNNNDKEIIVLSSQTSSENAIILNTWTQTEESHSYSLPFKPPCISETLNKARMSGMCLDSYLQNRFNLCNVGSTLLTDAKGEVSYFIQNSIGDIFYQGITYENMLDEFSHANTKACYALCMWEKTLLAQPEPLVPLTLTDKCDMQYIHENLTNRKLRLKTEVETVDDSFDPAWKQSLSTLASYIDILAPELLAVWDISEEAPVPVSTTSHKKVMNWLESSTAERAMQLEDEFECTPTPVNSQELISVSQQPDIASIDDTDILQDIFLPKVISRPIRKKNT